MTKFMKKIQHAEISFNSWHKLERTFSYGDAHFLLIQCSLIVLYMGSRRMIGMKILHG